MCFQQALEPFEANGIILHYEVTIIDKSSLSSPLKHTVNTTDLTLSLPNGTYEVTVIAHNTVGASPPSVLLIPASNSKGWCPLNVHFKCICMAFVMRNLQCHRMIHFTWTHKVFLNVSIILHLVISLPFVY